MFIVRLQSIYVRFQTCKQITDFLKDSNKSFSSC